MSSRNDDDIDMSDVKIEVDGDLDGEDVKPAVVNAVKERSDNEAATPVEDRFGRSLWIPTRMCQCSDTAPTDCRFHSSEEEGWETCPNLATDAKHRASKPRQLWARNPQYGKNLTEDEVATTT